MAERQHSGVALMFMDIDHFKNINDSLGHRVGDALLVQIAQRLQGRAARPGHPVSRLGGDEFVVLVVHLQQAEQPPRWPTSLLQATNGPYDIAGHELAVTLSIGIALYPADGRTSRPC